MNYDSAREIVELIMQDRYAYTGREIINIAYLQDLCMLYYKTFAEKYLPAGQIIKVQLKARRDAMHSAKYMKKDGAHYIIYNPYVLNAMAAAKEVIIDGKSINDIRRIVCAVTEHELTHMAENVLYGKTAHGVTFKQLRYKLFGTDIKAPCNYKIKDDSTSQKYSFRPGDMVGFTLKDGTCLIGGIERIVKRATVTVKSKGRYLGKKFYVPLKMLHYV